MMGRHLGARRLRSSSGSGCRVDAASLCRCRHRDAEAPLIGSWTPSRRWALSRSVSALQWRSGEPTNVIERAGGSPAEKPLEFR